MDTVHTYFNRNLADDIFRCMFVNDKFCILLKISVNFVRKGPIDNNRALVKIIWTNADEIRWRLYAALGGDKLNTKMIMANPNT